MVNALYLKFFSDNIDRLYKALVKLGKKPTGKNIEIARKLILQKYSQNFWSEHIHEINIMRRAKKFNFEDSLEAPVTKLFTLDGCDGGDSDSDDDDYEELIEYSKTIINKFVR